MYHKQSLTLALNFKPSKTYRTTYCTNKKGAYSPLGSKAPFFITASLLTTDAQQIRPQLTFSTHTLNSQLQRSATIPADNNQHSYHGRPVARSIELTRHRLLVAH